MFDHIHHVAYAVNDMDHAVSVFRDTFELELNDRQVVEGDPSFEMATFLCGQTILELLRPIHHPALTQFLKDHGPGLHHVAFAVRDLPKRIEELRGKGVSMKDPGAFIAGKKWKIAYFDLDNTDLDLFQSHYHGDHLVEANPLK